jgi:hypothetical protein
MAGFVSAACGRSLGQFSPHLRADWSQPVSAWVTKKPFSAVTRVVTTALAVTVAFG